MTLCSGQEGSSSGNKCLMLWYLNSEGFCGLKLCIRCLNIICTPPAIWAKISCVNVDVTFCTMICDNFLNYCQGRLRNQTHIWRPQSLCCDWMQCWWPCSFQVPVSPLRQASNHSASFWECVCPSAPLQIVPRTRWNHLKLGQYHETVRFIRPLGMSHQYKSSSSGSSTRLHGSGIIQSHGVRSTFTLR